MKENISYPIKEQQVNKEGINNIHRVKKHLIVLKN